ncbi:unnamed protein product [Vitrella brassicaformis CCMP3155]|uniref:Uncharacterized protein n=2 Tax=Vitrella brassicaformis TaxID=1169539 RepID=A0A0G4GMM4_VITBC|nr:unnamed protein product [Vitrella brassicaformis CCMP3155]|mmetsp:Transcript_38850/g.97165  ORF Transcript_38850/g.97165 Transcript_38850/m.97165 type:complete len:161 (+) Transcript_38850:107-589(+)|eukprot:CEM31380.1 unnamed protein product [Vitrella brassicaformis CCMP3155]
MVRLKVRWLALSFEWEERTSLPPLTSTHLMEALRESLEENFGEMGLGRNLSRLKVIYFSPATGFGVIRCARTYYQLVWAALTLMTSIGGVRVAIQVIHCSGTIKRLQTEVIGSLRTWLEAFKTILTKRNPNLKGPALDLRLSEAQRHFDEAEKAIMTLTI